MLHLSTMSGKLKGMRALNTDTTSNPFCIYMYENSPEDFICHWCYSWYMMLTYRKNCVKKWKENSDALSVPIPYDDLPILNDVLFRIDAHGELINLNHMVNLHWLAVKNPGTTIGLWTKRKPFVRQYLKQFTKPSNLMLIYSNGAINKPMSSPPKGFDKVFQNVSPDKSLELQNCTGQTCMSCRLCYTQGTDVITEAVKIKFKRVDARRLI